MFLRPSLFFYCSGQALSECQGTIFMPVVTRFTLLTVGTSYPLSLLPSSPLKCSEEGREPQKHTPRLPVLVSCATSSPFVHLYARFSTSRCTQQPEIYIYLLLFFFDIQTWHHDGHGSVGKGLGYQLTSSLPAA